MTFSNLKYVLTFLLSHWQ